MPGRSCRCDINQSMTRMNTTARAEDAIQYGKYLQINMLVLNVSKSSKSRRYLCLPSQFQFPSSQIQERGEEGEKNLPRNPHPQLILHRNKIRINPQYRTTAHQHDKQPEIQLQRRPSVLCPHAMHDDFRPRHGGARRCHVGRCGAGVMDLYFAFWFWFCFVSTRREEG